jgi:hypothetical protein
MSCNSIQSRFVLKVMLLHRCFELAGIYGIVVSGSSFVRLKITVPAISKWQITLVNLIKNENENFNNIILDLLDFKSFVCDCKVTKSLKKKFKRENLRNQNIFLS